ncbi:HlyD family secretion protein [Brucella pseudogrignonensis]|jgi:multidrug resistance efflux pump|uniref:efflux RND transporter periplasmic adaptor subunit n=1 Tax=Brucella pseudogrignonensis TaxID=419475 RepID=UPI000CFC385C|nr:HlyD family secretion protein [Brucella pseudogrignonensis]MQP40200.1 efflux RND transporter periplasmic adaptor subunit [Ochrobactrum sp. MYb237]PQZ39123.1 efflux transporter periplasmic adaptor subunit [Brucella pseudogrignonensis]PRA41513.1 efflux transporter periplasmic adaptor subunit [Brucella pseudogrignonensis]PRA60793.1 efflux transporter periplasmic adaptor subunit [Brucella pseudogrignonensis]
MTSLLSLFSRYLITLCVVALAALVAFHLWQRYESMAWTRNARVSVDVVQIAPEVSGTIRSVSVHDNQHVQRGDILYAIDPERFRLAVINAEAEAEARRQDMLIRQAAAKRRSRLGNIASQEVIEQAAGEAAQAGAAYQGAKAALELAKLNLARTMIRSPVEGYVTNLRLRDGGYVKAGETKIAIIDSASFWITGYFEETRLRRIQIGLPARMKLMGFDQPVTGHVESIGRGIEDDNGAPGHLGLPNVAATFSWVRLAQRIPVHIHIDKVPAGVLLVAGMSAQVEIAASEADGSSSIKRDE